MGAPPLCPILARVIPLAAAMLVTGCADEGLTLSHPTRVCTAPRELIDAYLDRVAVRVSNAMSSIALARFEQVTIAFEIAADGSVSHLALMSASTPVAAEAARDAVRTAAPYPPPLFDMKACLIGGRAEVSVYSSGKCDEPRADRYLDAVAAGIQTAVVKKGVAAKYDGDVILRLDIARDGVLNSVVVQRADSDEAGAAVAAAARGLSRFEPPDELIQDCVAGNHLLIWIPLSEL